MAHSRGGRPRRRQRTETRLGANNAAPPATIGRCPAARAQAGPGQRRRRPWAARKSRQERRRGVSLCNSAARKPRVSIRSDSGPRRPEGRFCSPIRSFVDLWTFCVRPHKLRTVHLSSQQFCLYVYGCIILSIYRSVCVYLFIS